MTIPARPVRRSAAFALLFILLTAALPADELYSDRGFFIDLPEGFGFTDGDGKTRFSFASPDGAVQVDMAVYDSTRYPSAQAASDETAKRISARIDSTRFRYAGRDAALGTLSFGSGTGARKGLAFFLDGKPAAAAGSASAGTASDPGYDLAVLVYAPASAYARYKDLVESTMDGFSGDYARRAAPGPVGTAARAALVASRTADAAVRFGAATITLPWNPDEGRAAQAIVEREYRVLMPYGSEPDLVEAAIRRFYRMVWRDSAPSLDRLALELSRAWDTGAWAGGPVPGAATTTTPATPPADAVPESRFGTAADPRGFAEAVLRWTQGFRYERDPAGSDVVNPLSAALGRGDCDSRALVIAIVLRRADIEALLMLSLVHEHALAAVDAPGAGARFPYRGANWLVGETTAPVAIGMIDQEQSNIEDWMAIDFPF